MKLINVSKVLFVTLFALFGMVESYAQTGNITGTISDENGIYVSGANIYISSLNRGSPGEVLAALTPSLYLSLS